MWIVRVGISAGKTAWVRCYNLCKKNYLLRTIEMSFQILHYLHRAFLTNYKLQSVVYFYNISKEL
jgi:hypothetical protein